MFGSLGLLYHFLKKPFMTFPKKGGFNLTPARPINVVAKVVPLMSLSLGAGTTYIHLNIEVDPKLSCSSPFFGEFSLKV